MNILITGQSGLAESLANALDSHTVTQVSRSTGHDINCISNWGVDFLDYDSVINCAYDGLGQQLVLEYFYHHWYQDNSKQIITIGSKVITQPRINQELEVEYWAYRQHKQTLQLMYDRMVTTAKCDMKIINPGAIDTPMIAHQNIVKMSPDVVASKIKNIIEDPTIKRVDLWL